MAAKKAKIQAHPENRVILGAVSLAPVPTMHAIEEREGSVGEADNADMEVEMRETKQVFKHC